MGSALAMVLITIVLTVTLVSNQPGHPTPPTSPAGPTTAVSMTSEPQNVVSAATQPSAAPSPSWTELNGTVHPSARQDAGMVYDATDGYVLLFGGWEGPSSGQACLNDTWTFHDGNWTRLAIPGPPPACTPAMAYDPALGYVVAFISQTGDTSGDYANETWAFAHGSWWQLNVAEPDYFDYWEVSTYDARDQAVLMVGNAIVGNNSGILPETWEFQGDGWYQVPNASTPYEAYGWSQMTYDPVTGDALILGNSLSNASYGAIPNDTWTFSSGKWTENGTLPSGLRTPFTLPVYEVGENRYLAMTFDSKDGYALLYDAPWLFPRP
ncbi:hypothetical protein B1B_18459, partial [mine drainage metagenome]